MNATSALAAVKMHGAENTFVVLDARAQASPPPIVRAGRDALAALAKMLCAPAGPMDGADGILVIGDAAPATAHGSAVHEVAVHGDAAGSARKRPAIAEMQIFNADGSEAEMCGNGVRCVARYLRERGAGGAFTIATLAGPIGVEIVRDAPFAVRLDMGPVRFPRGLRAERFRALGTTWTYYDVSLGNPHAVVFVDDREGVDTTGVGGAGIAGELDARDACSASDAIDVKSEIAAVANRSSAFDAIDLAALGRTIQGDPRFPAGTNLHLATTIEPNHFRVRHYERGVGLTRACGTGAVAVAAAAIAVRGALSSIAVDVPGGRLDVAWRSGENAYLTGPAETMFARTLAL